MQAGDDVVALDLAHLQHDRHATDRFRCALRLLRDGGRVGQTGRLGTQCGQVLDHRLGEHQFGVKLSEQLLEQFRTRLIKRRRVAQVHRQAELALAAGCFQRKLLQLDVRLGAQQFADLGLHQRLISRAQMRRVGFTHRCGGLGLRLNFLLIDLHQRLG